MRTLFLATGTFLLFGSIIVLLSAFLVNHLKNELVREAHEEVQRVAVESVERIEEVVRQREREKGQPVTSLAEVANDPEVKAQLRIMSSTGSVVMSAMMDSNGKCFYQQFGDENTARTLPVPESNKIGGMLPAGDTPLTWEMELRKYPDDVVEEKLPLRGGSAKIVGYVSYGIEPNRTLDRLDPISHRITNSLAWMVTAVLLCLGLALAMLHLVWKRHYDLQQRHREARHLANLGTLASGLAHEIRNPLHAMNLHLDTAREELEDSREGSPEFAARTIANVQRQISSLNSIVSNFMSFAVPSRLEREPIRLAALAGEVATLLEPEFRQRGARLVRELPENAWVLADPTAIRQVFINVLLNAAQALEDSEKREVRLHATPSESGDWRIYIDDTGPGLPAGKEEEIFQVFVSGRKGGSGFGLPIARRHVEAHGGHLRGETRGEGGARFVLDLPAAKAPEGYATREAAASAADTSAAPVSVG